MEPKELGVFILVTIGMIGSSYFYLYSIPGLTYPLRSIDGWAFSDGGSVTLEVVDADGQSATLGVAATGFARQLDQHLAFFGRSVLGISVPLSAAAGSERKVKIMTLAHEIARSGLSAEQLASVERDEMGGLGEMEQRYLVAWAIYQELMERHEAERK